MSTLQFVAPEKARPELTALEYIQSMSMEAQVEAMDVLREEQGDSRIVDAMRCNWIKGQADIMLAQGNYREAIQKYTQALEEVVGPDFKVPAEEYVNAKYMTMTIGGDWKAHLDLAACCESIAECYIELGMVLEAMDWLQEVEVLYNCQRLGSYPDELTLMVPNVYLPVEDHFICRMKAYNHYSKLFYGLGNTAASTFFAQRTSNLALGLNSYPRIRTLDVESRAEDKTGLRHPEPQFVDRWEVTDRVLQVRGAWTKLNPSRKGSAPPSRFAFSSWIWKSKLYVCGGQHSSGLGNWKVSFHQDVWCLNLLTMDKWRRLPDFPSAPVLHHTIKAWNNKAWFFTGSKRIWTLDLIHERWRHVDTTLSGAQWPYFHNVYEYCMEIFEGIMYVFGGNDLRTYLGTNIFMALNLSTLEWTHLGGTSFPTATSTEPMLREHASSFIVPSQNRLYILYGNASRLHANIVGNRFGDKKDYTYEDLWSYSIPEKTWRRERLRGNFPSPRTEMGCAYNPGLGRAVVYGGYNACAATHVGEDTYGFAYYGDTFLFDPETLIWTHVLTRGFPSYRAQSRVVVDEETGRTYLFGGYTDSDFIPSKQAAQRTFGDLWQLSVDMSGGFLNEADLERDARAPKMGPWTKCFTCGRIGNNGRKCGGSCKGASFFCSTDCLKKGWKEHKEIHGCRKL